MFGRGLQWPVRSVVGEVQEERPRRIALDEVERGVRELVGQITLDW